MLIGSFRGDKGQEKSKGFSRYLTQMVLSPTYLGQTSKPGIRKVFPKLYIKETYLYISSKFGNK